MRAFLAAVWHHGTILEAFSSTASHSSFATKPIRLVLFSGHFLQKNAYGTSGHVVAFVPARVGGREHLRRKNALGLQPLRILLNRIIGHERLLTRPYRPKE